MSRFTFNLILIASAEEEIFRQKMRISSVSDQLPPCDFSTSLENPLDDVAVAEKGLMVIDG